MPKLSIVLVMLRRAVIVFVAVGLVAAPLPGSAQAAGDPYDIVFPVYGSVSYSDTFGAPRGGGRTHAGQDLMAAKMTPVVAAASGTVGWMQNQQGGNCCAMALQHDDGWESWYIHLNNDTPGTDDGQGWGFADGIEPGVYVEQGQLIGWVGDSGNAEATSPHVQFELHDPDGVVVNPFDALQAAPVVRPRGFPISPTGCDFNSDPYHDIAAGVGGPDSGGVAVIFGGTTIGSTTWAAGTDPAADVTCGDFDNDGFDDLAIGLPDVASNKGAVDVYMGSSSGLVTPPTRVHAGSPGVPGAREAGDRFGASVAAGDFDDDGFDDLAIGIPNEAFGNSPDVGMVVIIPGSPGGLDTSGAYHLSQSIAGAAGAAESDDLFGFALVVARVNDDNRDDLIVGVPGEDVSGKVNAGAIHLFLGSGSGLTTSGDETWSQAKAGIVGAAEDGDRFGSSLAAGDVDKDGRADVVVGIPGEDIGNVQDAGAIAILKGGSSGLRAGGDRLLHQDSTGLRNSAEDSDRFGFSVTTADFDDDGWLDVVVGVPGESTSGATMTGAVHIIYGSWEGVSERDKVVTQATSGVSGKAEDDDGFGSYVVSGDFNGDGQADIAVGTPDEDVSGKPDSGTVTVIEYGLIKTLGLFDAGDLLGGVTPGAGLGVVGE